MPQLSKSLFLLAFTCAAATPQLTRTAQTPALQALPIAISGRVQLISDPAALTHTAYRAQWPGTVYTVAFRGSELFFRVGANHEILHVVVDNQPPLLLTQPQPGTYQLSSLGNTRHTVQVRVATESQDAPNTFGGFGIPADEQPLTPGKSARQIEFIGDSHTVGYGNTSPRQTCTTDEVWATTDDTQAFGPIVARHFGADYQINAISGRGIVRNYNGIAAPTIPEAYPFTLFDQKQPYRDPTWHPQVLVIALGTNDFTTPLHPGEPWKSRDQLHTAFESRYLSFVEQLHAANPKAYIVLWATNLASGEIEIEVSRVAEQARARGITRLTYVPFDHLQLSGCHGHPSLVDDRTIADKLAQAINAQPAIWQGR